VSIEKRALGCTITLSQERSPSPQVTQPNSFAEGGNQVTLPAGLRMTANIQNAGGLSDGVLSLVIWGMTRSLMNQLATLGLQINLLPKNLIKLTAGTPGKMSTAFIGYITAAEADFNAMPEPSFTITAHTLGAFAAAPAEPSSYQGAASVSSIMSDLATKMGLRFENSGVDVTLKNPVFTGSYRDQARACVKQAGILWNNGAEGLLAIWPRNGSRGGLVPVIAPPPKGSMIGFPKYNAFGVTVKNLYDPTIGFGQKVKIESSVLSPGEYVVIGLAHALACEFPSGPWETTITGYNPSMPTPLASAVR
jgi:hypothetical protein